MNAGTNQPHTIPDTEFALAGTDAVLSETKGGLPITTEATESTESLDRDGLFPNDEEKKTLRRIPGKVPVVAYLLCFVEFAERSSWYGVTQVFGNFVNRKLPIGGNGAGAPAKGTQDTAGALGKGTAISNAIKQSYQMIAYVLPILGGWLADTKTGRFKMVCYGVAIFGVAHVILIIAAIPKVIQSGKAFGPFALGVYSLAIGAGMYTIHCDFIMNYSG